MSALSIPAVSAHPTRPRRLGGAIATLLLVLTLPAAALAGAPTITDLGTLPGGIMSLAGGMNALGQIAGAADTNAGADVRAFLWDPATGMQGLGTLAGESQGHAVNPAGQVAGAARNAEGRRHAFLWEAAAGMSDLGTLPGGTISAAYGVNGAGQVVGESSVAGFEFRAFLWAAAAGMQDLGTLPGGSYSLAWAINDAGQVVGEADAPDPVTGDLVPRAFLWDAAGGMRDLGALPGGRSAVARAINTAGQVVGWSETGDGAVHAFLWDPVAGMTDLGTLGGGPESRAFGVNDAGQVVGGAVLGDGITRHAFLWDPAAGMQDLGTLPGGAWSEAYAINDAGHVMGQATTAAGEDRAVRWQLNRAPAPGLPGRMHGHGYIESEGRHHHFEFHAGVNAAGEPSGRLRYHVEGRRHGWGPEGKPATARPRGGRFVASAITAAVFSDDPALSPGHRPGPRADTAVLGGTGSWNGAPGYRFEARASEAGEPGRGRDTFAITISAPDGTVVAAVSGRLTGGNIQARRPAP